MTTHNISMSEHASASASVRVGDTVDSTSDQRVIINVMRHEYRVLDDTEKANMQRIKDTGLAFWQMVDGIGQTRELSLAKTKIEEAVFWACKHITK